MGRIKMSKKVLIVFILILLFLEICTKSMGTLVYADSNTRLQTSISWSQKKAFQDMNADDLGAMTEDDLRMIGVFLSNFYVPFVTTIGEGGTVDIESEVKDSMVTALVDQCNFNKEVAEALVPMIWNMSLTCSKKLVIGELTDDGKVEPLESYKIAFDDKYPSFKTDTTYSRRGVQASYYNFLVAWSGGVSMDKVGDSNTSGTARNSNFCLFWEDDAKTPHIVFDAKNKLTSDGQDEYTASQLAYIMLNDQVSYQSGVGSNIFATPDYDSFKQLADDDRATATVTASQLYVDTFGNILMDFGGETTVVVPACVNPYSWYDAKDGVDSAGARLNCINQYFIAKAEGKKIKLSSSGSNSEEIYFLTLEPETTPNLLNLNYFRLWKNGGNSESNYTLDTSIFDGEFENIVKGAIKGKTAYDDDGVFDNDHLNFPAWDNNSNHSDFIYGQNSLGRSPIYSDFCMIDTLNVFTKASSENVASVIKTMNLFTEVKDDSGKFKGKYDTILSGFTGMPKYSSIKDPNKLATLTGSAQKAYLVSIYLSYVYAYYDESKGTDRKVSWCYNKDAFPISESPIDWSSIEIESDAFQTELMSLAYYFIHPSKGIELVKEWFKNKVSGILVGWHEDMVGSASGVATSGSTRYIGFSGYVTIPNLSDLSWTDWLLTQYDSLVVYFIIIIAVVLLVYVMVGSLTFQRAILGTIIFAVCAYLPPKMIDTTVNCANTVCDSIYSSKFTYWALAQHYQYQNEINSAVNSENEQNYLSAIFREQVKDNSDNYSVVTLKWQCPKKENYLSNIRKELNDDIGNDNVFRNISGLISEQVGGESYVEDANNLYLYRSYTDIASYSKYIYLNSTGFMLSDMSRVLDLGYLGTYNSSTSNKDDLIAKGNNFRKYIGVSGTGSTSSAGSLRFAFSNGFVYNTLDDNGNLNTSKLKHIFLPLGSSSVRNAVTTGLTKVGYSETAKLADILKTNLSGIPQQKFNATLADLNQGVLKVGSSTVKSSSSDVNRSDAISLMSFANYTESPYYYFSFNLQDQLNALKEKDITASYKDLFLTKDGGYFYNNYSTEEGVYGEFKDYMDMRSLFYTTIPYLKSANNVVLEWDNTYGLYMYDDVELDYTEDYVIKAPPELCDAKNPKPDLVYKYWHNANVAQLLNMYTPWVDTMYSCDYAKREKISVAGSDFWVEDPLNPYSYYKTDSSGTVTEGRLMVFSRSEMAFYGLGEEDLTQVERKIITMYDNTYENLLPLMDYYNFGDEVLNTGAAMLEVFEFNKQFSQNDPFGSDYTLYPQSYELKNFSYDAFLRLILSETTGEDIGASYSEDGSMYMTVVKNSSILTGIMYILVDLLAVYALPALKLFFLVLIFFLSIALVLCATVNIDISLPRVLWKSLVSPLLRFLLITLGLAFVVSLFMSNGNTAVTGRGGFTISLGDPVFVLLAMLVLNALALVLYFKTTKSVIRDCITYTRTVAQSVKGVFGGLFAGGLAGLMIGKAKVSPSLGAENSTVAMRSKANISGNTSGTGVSGSTGVNNAGVIGTRGTSHISDTNSSTSKASRRPSSNRYNNKINRYQSKEAKYKKESASYQRKNFKLQNKGLKKTKGSGEKSRLNILKLSGVRGKRK